MEEDEESALKFFLDLVDTDTTESCKYISPDEKISPYLLSESLEITQDVGTSLKSHLQCDLNAIRKSPSSSIDAKPIKPAHENLKLPDDRNSDTDEPSCNTTVGEIYERHQSPASVLVSSESSVDSKCCNVDSPSHLKTEEILHVPCLQSLNSLFLSANVTFVEDSVEGNTNKGIGVFLKTLVVPCLENLNTLLQRYTHEEKAKCDDIEGMNNCSEKSEISCLQNMNCILRDCKVKCEEVQIKCSDKEELGLLIKDLQVPCLEGLNSLLKKYKLNLGGNDYAHFNDTKETEAVNIILKIPCLQSLNSLLPYCKVKLEDNNKLSIKDCQVPCLESLNSLLIRYKTNSDNHPAIYNNTVKLDAINDKLLVPCLQNLNNLFQNFKIKIKEDQIRCQDGEDFISDLQVPCVENPNTFLKECKTTSGNDLEKCDDTTPKNMLNAIFHVPCLQTADSLLGKCKIVNINCDHNEKKNVVKGLTNTCFENLNSLILNCDANLEIDHCCFDYDSRNMVAFKTNLEVPCLQSMDSLLKLFKMKNVLYDHNEEQNVKKDLASSCLKNLNSVIQNQDAKSEINHCSYDDDNKNIDIIKINLEAPCLQNLDSLQQSDELRLKKSHVKCDSNNESKEQYSVNGFNRTVKDSSHLNFENILQEYLAKGFKFKTPFFSNLGYGVDVILSHKYCNGEKYYYVKWKNYSSESNSWVLSSDISLCQDIIDYYHALQTPKTKINQEILKFFIQDLTSRKPWDIPTLTKVCALVLKMSWREVSQLNLTVPELCETAKDIKNVSFQEASNLEQKLLNIMIFREKRKAVLIEIMEWQDKINLDNKGAFVEVENNVDLKEPPKENFLFINDYIYDSTEICEDPIVFCKCSDCFKEKNTCCSKHFEAQLAYNEDRLLTLKPGFPIYECNKKCSCDINCINRVVQNGPKVALQIFRTSNECGWGLKTLEDIKKGQFVIEYLGEVITYCEAEARGVAYDYDESSYLFDLEYGEDNIPYYTVDAFHMGNAAHFINHSCDPNLVVFAVWINHQDPRMPRIAMFAKRKIQKGEELTFDYKMVKKSKGSQKNSKRFKRNEVLCKCKSKNCRKYLF